MSLNDVASHAGLERSRVQFIIREFGEWLMMPEGHAKLDSREVTLVKEIHHWLFSEGRSSTAIRTDLARRRRGWRAIAVTSGKGGVGKTTMSINLAIALAQAGQRVLLFDADLGLANVHVFAGLSPKATLLDVIEGQLPLREAIVPGPGGVHFLCGASGVGRLADLPVPTLEALARELARVAGDYDVLLIDTGAGISAQVVHFLSLAHELVIVATPNLAATLDAYGVIKVAREQKIPARMHVLVNEAGDVEQAAAVLTRICGCADRFLGFTPESLGWIARDAAFEEANQRRQPLLLSQPENANARRLRDIAARLFTLAGASRAATG